MAPHCDAEMLEIMLGLGVAVGGTGVAVGGRGVWVGADLGGATVAVGGIGVAVGPAFPQPAIKVKTIATITFTLKRMDMVLPFSGFCPDPHSSQNLNR